MYRYDPHDMAIVQQRAAQFRGQVKRRLDGEISEDEFKPLRLQNGLYMQLHAYMLRVAIPYGLLSTAQVRQLAHIARTYDKGYAHFTTRQNVQFNWPRLEDVPSILDDLAAVEMHAIQTSGNCVRNITSDPFAGVAGDEIADPRPYCEILRQWSTFHPEFAFLPRKFKIAVTGAKRDRAAVAFHDIGLRIVEAAGGGIAFQVIVGGGLGRTPMVGPVIREELPERDLLSYVEAILRVYNRYGRRDNKFKARIKILVDAMGTEAFAAEVEQEWREIKDGGLVLDPGEVDRVRRHFTAPDYLDLPEDPSVLEAPTLMDPDFRRWVAGNVMPHRRPGYRSVVLSLKNGELPPGDATHHQLDAVADLADEYGFGEIVVTHRQNLVFPDVEVRRLHGLWQKLHRLGFATPNVDKLTDIISCPGLDYCTLANARSIPIAQAINRRLDDLDTLFDVGELHLNISGCINACGHHHIGHIGILGINKAGEEYYQLMVGGSNSDDASLATVLGRAFSADDIVGAVETVLRTYLTLREHEDERFLDATRRLGLEPFKEALYGTHP
ncbi:MAG: nitrite/sulfite reductase [Myxococcales bacterium]|nr:nitrite/sulfite reductase [Myxococcales bacterium]